MKKSHIILAAVILYLLIMVIGFAAYYAYSVQHEQQQAKIEQEAQQEIAARRQAREAADKARGDEETGEKPRKAVQRPERADSGMWEETIHGVTYYKHHWPKKLPTGVYLRPFVAAQNEHCVLKNDIYYYYSITDAEQTAWIMGDRLDIYAGGQTTTLQLDPKELRKHMSSDASWLSENYVMNADAATLAAFRRIIASGSATLVYYKEGGKARRHDMSAQEIQNIREMVELYDALRQE